MSQVAYRTATSFHTALSPQQCWERLATIADAYRVFFSWRFFRGDKPLLARRNGDRFELAARRFFERPVGVSVLRSRSVNSFHFYGRIVPDGQGSRIEGEFRLSRFERNQLLIIWSVWAAIIVTVGIVADSAPMGHLRLWSMALFMILMPAILIWWNLFWDHKHVSPIVPLVEETLEATGE